MNEVYIYHHLGLGDHIIANGMVRTIAKKYDKVFLFCKPRNFRNVSYMYRDLSHLKIIPFDDAEVIRFMTINPNNNYIVAGHTNFWIILNTPGNKLTIDEIFYQLAGVPIENKWSEFFILRDMNKEKYVFKELGLHEGDTYCFLHDDENRRITKNFPTIKTVTPDNMNFSVFDYLYTIENAKEIQCINSSFFCLIDCMKIQRDKMCVHEYARPNATNESLGKYFGKWEIIK
jgi:hypothetical protein